jgi:ABC-2 type transport system permease protein
VVARLTARRSLRSAVLWGSVFGLTVASSALTYDSVYRTAADRQRLAATFATNSAVNALYGPAVRLQTAAGFAAFKASMTLMVVGAVWGLLTATRLLRGEEDAGRWELLLTGATTRRGAAAQGLAGLAAGAVVLWTLSAVVIVVVGRSSEVGIGLGAGLYLALALVSTAVVFLAVGAVTSQLAATRRQAAGWAGVVLGVSYALRMVGDAHIGLHALVWTTPLGWVEELRPLTDPQPAALVPLALLTALLAGTAVHLAGRRDVGSGILPDRTTARPRLHLLGGPTALTVRLTRPVVLGWVVAVGLTALLTGLVASAAGSSAAGSSVDQVYARLGATGGGTRAFLGVTFLILAVLVAFVAAGQVTAARSEEAGGRLDHLVVRPVSRTSWFAGRLAVGALALVLAGLVAGFGTWLGVASQRHPLPVTTALAAGLNVVAPALCLLGLGALVLGVVPRAAGAVVYAVLGWSLLVEVVGAVGDRGRDLVDTSVFHVMASAPAVPPDWRADGALAAVGVVAAVAGAMAFTRRDLQGE